MFSSSKYKSYGSDGDDDYYRRHRSYNRSSPDYRSSYGRNSPHNSHYYNSSSAYNKKNKQYQTVVLRMQFHCDGCVIKVRDAISGIKGVDSVVIDERRDKVTVTGYINPHKIHKKASNTGKYVEIECISTHEPDHRHRSSRDYHRGDVIEYRNHNYDPYHNSRDGSSSYYHYADEYPHGYNRRGNYYSDYSYQEDNSGCTIM